MWQCRDDNGDHLKCHYSYFAHSQQCLYWSLNKLKLLSITSFPKLSLITFTLHSGHSSFSIWWPQYEETCYAFFSSLQSFLFPFYAPHIRFSYIFKLHSSFMLRDQVAHPYMITNQQWFIVLLKASAWIQYKEEDLLCLWMQKNMVPACADELPTPSPCNCYWYPSRWETYLIIFH